MSWGILDLLVRASLGGALAILVVGAASILLARAPSLRCRLWWIACLKLLVGLAGVAPISLPILPAASSSSALVRMPTLPASPFVATSPDAPSIPWRSAIVLVYLAGVGIGTVLTLRQLARARRVIRLAEPIRDPRVVNLLVELCGALRLRRVPALRASDLVSTPQVVGSLRPVILLPRTEIASFSRVDLALTLCHELIHVRRRDLLLGWVPALARRFFFFHPGAWIAAREYALAREAACDAEVIRALGASPRRYGRLLVEMSLVCPRALAPAAAVSPSFLHLRRRLRMLEQATDVRPQSKLRWAMVALLAAAVLVPVRLAARQDPPSGDSAIPSAPSVRAERHVRNVVPPRADMVAVDAYVFFLDESSVAMSGSMEDLERARGLRGSRDGELLWLRKGNKEYVVRDPSVLEPIRELHASLGESGDGQDEVGRKEEELAREQDRLAAEEDELSARAEALTGERERLAEDTRGDDENKEEMARNLERLATEARRMEQQRGEREQEVERLDAMLDELSAKQDKIGEEAERVSERIEQQIREILEQALRSGIAERVWPTI
jgi:bla regulator protein BlaR1